MSSQVSSSTSMSAITDVAVTAPSGSATGSTVGNQVVTQDELKQLNTKENKMMVNFYYADPDTGRGNT